ncbi:MAG: class I SAM-dependent methyltransferase [Candidatus Aegiribacteria sp.]|nr:class I SAM-dependent methyltransferase [Candidatus Aegiribacteria sp.]
MSIPKSDEDRIDAESFIIGKPEWKDDGLWLGPYQLMSSSLKDWVTKGTELLCERFAPRTVLECGFGLGYSATVFQKYKVKHHVILEPNREVYKSALKWKQQNGYSNAEILALFSWEYDFGGIFDLVYDDRYDPVRIARNHEEYQKMCCANTLVSTIPLEKKVERPEPSFFFEFNEKVYTQPIFKYETNKDELLPFFNGQPEDWNSTKLS